MRGKCHNILVYVTSMLFFLVLFSSSAYSGRPPLLEARRYSQSNVNKSNNVIRVESATLNESKVVLIFCHKTKCDTPWVDCYCCINKRPEEICYYTLDQCKANCPVCSPKCPPQFFRKLTMKGRPLHRMINSTSYRQVGA
ncbi:unnamed protein product [Urochloa decumbens]|uniref:Bowman-Birk serine protease inhibitors family domain-containing protein n=1 Tax=Urochloa decumbens TaxID=240449 RepID=A0ABC8X2W9_9POAL